MIMSAMLSQYASWVRTKSMPTMSCALLRLLPSTSAKLLPYSGLAPCCGAPYP